MPKYVTTPLDLPPRDDVAEYSRADLIFYRVNHYGPSYTAHVFFDNPDADESTPLDAEHGYAGNFTIFGHNGCAGDEGHCVPEDEPLDEFDFASAHPLTPVTKSVQVTDALSRAKGDQVTVTVVPVEPHDDGPKLSDALKFDSVRLVTYEKSVTAGPMS
jgi:tyrosinase